MAVQKEAKMRRSRRKDIEITISDFKGGCNSYLDEARLSPNTLRSAINMMLDQDGVLVPRWGSKTYGALIDGNPDGFGTFSKQTLGASGMVLEEWQLAVIDGVVHKQKDGAGWTVVTGATLTTDHDVDILQIASRVYLGNKHDRLAYYDIDADEVFSFTELSAPDAPTLTRSGDLSTGSYTQYYRITAINQVGETIASTEVSITTDVPRTQWRQTDTIDQYVDLSWTAVTDADRYNIYYSDMADDECYIDSVSDNAYRDDAHTTANIAVKYPEDDTTGGPVVGALASSDNRLFAIGADNKIYWGGVGRNIGAFSPFFGGGWIEINKGSGEIPVCVRSYRDGRGEPVNVVFMTTVSGEGSQYQLVLTSLTVGTTSFISAQVARVVGSYGTSAADSVVEAQNNLFFASTQGFFTTGAKPSLLNVLSTDEISLAIRPEVRGISNIYSRVIASIYFENKILWAVPASNSSQNSEIWVLDLELKAWIRPWTIGVKKFASYTPSDGRERLLALKTTPDEDGKYRIVELSKKYKDDDGVPFNCSARTGLIHFDKGHMSFAKIEKVYIEMLRMSGSVGVAVSGTAKNKTFRSLKNLTINTGLVTSGYSTERYSKIRYSKPVTIPTTYSAASTKKVLKIRKTVNNFQIDIRSSSASYALAGFFIIAKPKKVPDPSAWK